MTEIDERIAEFMTYGLTYEQAAGEVWAEREYERGLAFEAGTALPGGMEVTEVRIGPGETGGVTGITVIPGEWEAMEAAWEQGIEVRQQVVGVGIAAGAGAALLPGAAISTAVITKPKEEVTKVADVKPGDSITTAIGQVTGAITPAVLTKLGVVGTIAAAAYTALKLVGMAMPWETANGEGFIAPWSPKVRDENGLWVTAATRPDLFPNGDQGFIDGVKVVKTWKAGGWPFSMTADGYLHTVTKNGIMKRWKPKKPIVLVRGSVTLNQAVRAQRMLDKMWRTVAKKTKQLKLA